jgi:hypothetical protein
MAKKKREIEENYTEDSPFLIRRPLVRLWQMIFFGLAMTVTIYASIYYGSENLRNFIVMLFGILIIILLYFIQNTYFDEKTATEFQCSVYAGAMRSNTMLSFILYQNCGIYYFDQRYLSEFRTSTHMHNFDNIMHSLGISDKQREKIAECVRTLKFYEFEHKAFDGQSRNNLIIGVYPLHRPKGYVYLSIHKNKD